MSQENVEAVRRLFAAFQSVDVGNFERRLDEVREIFDPEVEWVAAPHSLLASEEFRGYEGIRRFWTQFLSAWDEYGVQVDELIDAGDQVVAVMRLSGRTNELEVDEARSSLLTHCATEGSCGSSPLQARTPPSKPPGCGSRRLRE